MNGLLLAAQVESVGTRRDSTIKISLGLQELSPSKGAELLQLQNRLVAVYISPKDTIPASDIAQVDAVDAELPGKTPSQRLRAVLWRLWESAPEGFKEFDGFYRSKMEAMIEHFKSKIQ